MYLKPGQDRVKDTWACCLFDTVTGQELKFSQGISELFFPTVVNIIFIDDSRHSRSVLGRSVMTIASSYA